MNRDIDGKSPRSWRGKLFSKFVSFPETQAEFSLALENASKNNLLDADSIKMMKGVIQVMNMQARDIMIPRSEMVIVQDNETFDEVLAKIIDSGHSRFPVAAEKEDKIIGILLAKDLLNHQDNYKLDDMIRPVSFIPESKRLNPLLKEFRDTHNHIAIVVDEYGEVAGLVTIEDVIEQIVGDIEDEYDLADEVYINKQGENKYIIKAITPVEEFNQQFNTRFNDDQCDTIAGLIMHHCGYLPKKHETITIEKFHFTILQANERRIHLLEMTIDVDDK
ncbi:MAG: transporter associated domain-containing protein [Pseudomonadota bacterium]